MDSTSRLPQAATATARRIRLDGADTFAWTIDRGAVNIFASGLDGARRTGERLFLATAQHGGLIFPFPSMDGTFSACIEAEQLPGAVVRPISEEIFATKTSPAPEQLLQILEAFVRSTSWLFAAGVPPRNVEKRLVTGATIDIPASAALSGAGQVAWIRVRSGTYRYAGGEALAPFGAGDTFPLAPNVWIQAEEGGSVDVIDTATWVAADPACAAMRLYCRAIMGAAMERLANSEVVRFVSQSRRESIETAELSQALGTLASVMGTSRSFDSATDPLQDVFCTVARAAGATVRHMEVPSDSSADPLFELAHANRLMIREVTLPANWHCHDQGPLVGRLKDGAAPVALLPVAGGYECNNPRTGEHLRVTDESAPRIDARAWKIYPALNEPKLTPSRLLSFAFNSCKKDGIRILAMGFLAGLAGFAYPTATAYIMNNVIDTADTGMLWQLILGVMAAVIGGGVFTLARCVAFTRLEGRMGEDMQSALFARLLSLPIPFFRKFTAGDLSRRAMSVQGIQQILTAQLSNTLLSGIFTLMNIVLMLLYAWQLAVMTLGVTCVTVVFVALLCKLQMAKQTIFEDAIGKLYGLELQLATGIAKIRVAGAETRAFSRWARLFATMRGINYKMGMANVAVAVYAAGLPVCMNLLVYYCFVRFEMMKTLSLGGYLCFNAAMGQFVSAVLQMCGVGLSMVFLRPMYARAKPILETPPERSDRLSDPGPLNGALSANNLSFGYPGSPRILQGVSFRIEPGEFVAVVGPSGSGKSTLLRLLLGFETAQGGGVFYDGQNLAHLDATAVRRQIGTVLQNGAIMAGSMFENIAGGLPGLRLEDAWRAAALAGIARDIRAMPMAMQTVLPQGGGTLSGGQRQRILIARALVTQPKILFFDEATSALDNPTQLIVQESLERMQATRVVIAHRLSTIVGADRILVMSGGRIVQQGTYKELMENEKGPFALLAKRQTL